MGPPPGARLELSVAALQVRERATFAVRNRGDEPLEWHATEDLAWATVAPAEGRLAAGESAVEVRVSTAGLAPGVHVGRVQVGSNGGDAEITLTVDVPDIRAAPPSGARPNEPAPAPPGPPSSDGFAGRVTDLLGVTPVSGAAVTIGGAAVATDAAGWFVLGDPPPGVQPVGIVTPGAVARSTFVSTSSSLANPLTVIPVDFDLAAYHDVARDAAGTGTVRWVETPRIYLDVRPDAFSGRPLEPHWVAAAEAAARSFPAVWTGGRMAPDLEVGEAPPPDRTPGTVVVRFDEGLNPDGCGGSVGHAQFAWTDEGVLLWAVVRLAPARLCGASPAVLRAVVGHELGHAMGLGHATLPGRASLMEPSVRLLEASALDRAVARLHYGRAPGHAAPDREPAPFAFLNFGRRAGPNAPQRAFTCGGSPAG